MKPVGELEKQVEETKNKEDMKLNDEELDQVVGGATNNSPKLLSPVLKLIKKIFGK